MLSLSPPPSLYEALHRLPQKNHPLLRIDDEILHLHSYGEWISESLCNKELPLIERVMPISREELKLIENISFTRDLSTAITLGWSTLSNPNSPWYLALNLYIPLDNEYSYWRISYLEPQLKEKRIFLIERCQSFISPHIPQFDESTEYCIAIIERNELNMLFKDLNFDKDENKEEREIFLSRVYQFQELETTL